MPQITVDYSAELDDAFDRRGFAGELHPLVARTISTAVGNCKTRFRRVEETVTGDGSVSGAVVHIVVAMQAGRTPEVRALLSQSMVALLAEHLKPVDGLQVQISAETRDLDRSYRKN